MNKEQSGYNPFNDGSLHTTTREKQNFEEDRTGFNDAVKHYDAVNGFQSPKSTSGLPPRSKGIVRVLSLVGVYAFALFLVYTFISNVIASFK